MLLFKDKSELLGLIANYKNLYVIHYSCDSFVNHLNNYLINQTPTEFAKNFYHALRLGDNSNSEAIAIEAPPMDSIEWMAVWDRLNKAIVQIA